jgi:putative redox protein
VLSSLFDNLEEGLKMSDKAVLEWKGGLLFRGDAGGSELLLDGKREAGCSPMEALMLALAGCMAIDLVHILAKMRAEPRAVRAEIDGARAGTEPKRFTHVHLHFCISGENVRDVDVERAIALSREKYCSVYHTLRTDLELETSFVIEPELG